MSVDDDDEKTDVFTTHFDREGQPVSRPRGADVVWRISVYACIRNDAGQLLMIVPSWSDNYELPGGVVNVRESVEIGLKRAVYEETEMHVSIASAKPLYLGESNFYDTKTSQYCHSIYCTFPCVLLEKKGAPIPYIRYERKSQEIRRVAWVDFSALNNENLHPMHHELLAILRG